jgi:hypothetical protein
MRNEEQVPGFLGHLPFKVIHPIKAASFKVICPESERTSPLVSQQPV